MQLRVGDKVQVTICSGLCSEKIGRIVPRNSVKTNGRGIATNIHGHYKPVNWSKEVAVLLDDGELITMFKSRLIKIEEK